MSDGKLPTRSGAYRLWTRAAWLLACGGAVSVAALGVGGALAAGAPRDPRARAAAKVENIDETLSLKVTKIQGNTILSSGQQLHGQLQGQVSFKIVLENGEKASSSFMIVENDNHSNVVRGASAGHFHVSGAISYFTGNIASFEGTGSLSHARSLGVNVKGALNRRTYTVSATLKGRYIK